MMSKKVLVQSWDGLDPQVHDLTLVVLLLDGAITKPEFWSLLATEQTYLVAHLRQSAQSTAIYMVQAFLTVDWEVLDPVSPISQAFLWNDVGNVRMDSYHSHDWLAFTTEIISQSETVAAGWIEADPCHSIKTRYVIFTAQTEHQPDQAVTLLNLISSLREREAADFFYCGVGEKGEHLDMVRQLNIPNQTTCIIDTEALSQSELVRQFHVVFTLCADWLSSTNISSPGVIPRQVGL